MCGYILYYYKIIIKCIIFIFLFININMLITNEINKMNRLTGDVFALRAWLYPYAD